MLKQRVIACLATLLISLALSAARSADKSSDPIFSRIRHETVESTAVATVGYSKRLHALEIEFRRGGTYRYLEVPVAVYRGLMAADSKARFYNARIRGKYRSLRVRTARHQSEDE